MGETNRRRFEDLLDELETQYSADKEWGDWETSTDQEQQDDEDLWEEESDVFWEEGSDDFFGEDWETDSSEDEENWSGTSTVETVDNTSETRSSDTVSQSKTETVESQTSTREKRGFLDQLDELSEEIADRI